MGFSLDGLFAELFESLNSKMSDADKIQEVWMILEHGFKYAKECGQLRDDV